MSQITSTIAPQPAVEPDAGEFFLFRIAGGAGRLAASVVATVILLAALLLALAVTADLPGLFNSKLVDADFRNEFHQTFGNSDWPRLLRILGSVASFILAVAAVAIFMQVRRRCGVIHMLRALVAAVLFFVSILLLGRALPAWSQLNATENGWELLDQYVQHVANARVIAAAGPLLAAILLLLWPAGRRIRSRAIAAGQEAAR